MTAIDAAGLARRVREQGVRCTVETAEMFLAEWCARGLVREVLPRRFELTCAGLDVAVGLLDVAAPADELEEQAA